jgi:hypothetical protein
VAAIVPGAGRLQGISGTEPSTASPARPRGASPIGAIWTGDPEANGGRSGHRSLYVQGCPSPFIDHHRLFTGYPSGLGTPLRALAKKDGPLLNASTIRLTRPSPTSNLGGSRQLSAKYRSQHRDHLLLISGILHLSTDCQPSSCGSLVARLGGLAQRQ